MLVEGKVEWANFELFAGRPLPHISQGPNSLSFFGQSETMSHFRVEIVSVFGL